jgi:hypothetical protein
MIASNKSLKYSISIVAFILSSVMAFGQDDTPKNNKANRTKKLIQEEVGRPDLPGDLVLEFGFNWVKDHPPGYSFNTMKSPTFNIYYLYDMSIGESAFSYHPGFGVGTEKYTFSDDITLGYGLDMSGNREVQFVYLDSIYGPGTSFKKSQFVPIYLDIPMELRWRSKKYDRKKSVKVAIGGKVGLLIDNKTKVKYTDLSSETKKTKQKENFEMNTIRYGAYAKVGFGGFSAFYYYSFSDLFKKDNGPMGTTMYSNTFGVSLALF